MRSAQSTLPAVPSTPAILSAPAVPSVPAVSPALALPTSPYLPAVPALGSAFGCLPLRSTLSGSALRSKGHELPERLATPMRSLAQSLADVVAEEAARVPASRSSAGPFRVSSSPSTPQQLQMPVSVRPSSPPAPVRLSAAGACAHGNDSLFLAGDDEEGGSSWTSHWAPARAPVSVAACLLSVLLLSLLHLLLLLYLLALLIVLAVCLRFLLMLSPSLST